MCDLVEQYAQEIAKETVGELVKLWFLGGMSYDIVQKSVKILTKEELDVIHAEVQEAIEAGKEATRETVKRMFLNGTSYETVREGVKILTKEELDCIYKEVKKMLNKDIERDRMMEKAVNYYNFAEDDYYYLKENVEEGRISNAMCSSAQNICERYLKSVIEKSTNEMMNTEVMKTHSLKKIKRFIESFVPEFECEWKTVIQADGYYFTARCPGDDSFFVGEDDVFACWDAVKETKRATDLYLRV